MSQSPAPVTPAPDANPGSGQAATAGFAGWYLIFVLTLAYTVSFIDRQVLNLLVGPIKADFGLTDTRLSLLQGLAFTSAYVLMSPIFGRMADVGSRRRVLMFGVGLWSVGTSLCGLARSYWQLFFARFGVGGAEACLTPAAWSIIADTFPAHQMPRAFSIYMMGPYLGGGLALIFGGLLLDSVAAWDLSGLPIIATLKPWQIVFFLAGLPGIVIALLLAFVKEPPRTTSTGTDDQDAAMGWPEIRTFLVRWRGFYGNFYIGMPLLVIALYAFPAWTPTLLIRKFHATAGQVGLQYGSAVLITGSLGVLASPVLARWFDRFRAQDSLLFVPLLAALAMVPISLSLLLANTYAAALGIATLASLVYSLPQALASSALQVATPPRMRGVAASLYVFALSISGLALAPTIVALITNYLFRDEARVGDSLAITCALATAGAAFFLRRSLPHFRAMQQPHTQQANAAISSHR